MKSDSSELTIIKLGGSILTDKSEPYKLRREKIIDIAEEIGEIFENEKLIIIHGVGSFGHPPVKKYRLYEGYKGGKNLLHLAKTQSIVFDLRMELTKALQDKGINAMVFLPSSQIVADNMKIESFFLEPIRGFLELGMVPVLGGDMVFDRVMGFSVCSGDLMAVYLAEKLNARRLIFAMDVEGIYTSDPKTDEKARLLSEVSICDLDRKANVTGSMYIDVTKGMAGKVESLRKFSGLFENGTEVALLSMMERGNLKAYMNGREDAKFTKIIK